MPKRNDIKKIMVIGSGPIVIGQAAEFDYSGSQACKALREEGYIVILVNSNPATIMTDTDMADVVYVEPLNVQTLSKIIRKEKPDGLLPTMGGQTGLNLAKALNDSGVLKEVGVKILGTPMNSIEKGEDRELFKNLMEEIGEPVPKGAAIKSLEEARKFVNDVGFPVIVRPAYTLGGTGGGIAFDEKDLVEKVTFGLRLSPINQILIEEAILGINEWGEFELEVMRDGNDNCIVICPMENVDPMGIHTGESIVVAPTQALNDHDFQTLRSSAIKIIRALGVEGGCNIQFGFNYSTGEYRIIEVNPRVSRSSALASKATGYPIARIAAKIAIGMTLDEIPNDVTKETTACFEPTIDYVVVKIPRWPFDKFRTAEKWIGTQMKSTGETMAIGRTFEEALQKAVRSLEIGRKGLGFDGKRAKVDDLEKEFRNPTNERIFAILEGFGRGYSIDMIRRISGISPWFLQKMKNIYDFGNNMMFTKEDIIKAKRMGFCDAQIAHILNKKEDEIRKFRIDNKIIPTYKMVDTCAAEFRAQTPYLYSTYEKEDESNPSDREKIMIIGGGPIRIGQGIEFDYCCVHSVFALREMGVEAIIVNNNPETVSTDFDTSDKLYFEPLAFEDVLNIIEREKPKGVILQFGGQTPLNLAMKLYEKGINILGTHPLNVDIAEDREKFSVILNELKIPQAEFGLATSVEEAKKIVKKIGYPVLVRPSYVLGGRAMQIVYEEKDLISYMQEAVEISPEHPVLIDRFLDHATEIDVDAICDGDDVFVAAIMEHIEEAGIHSGDSTCVIPPQNLSNDIKNKIIEHTTKLAKALHVIGLLNIQYAVQKGEVYIIEANPRASRTVPYVSKTINVPLAKVATRIMMGKKLKELGLTEYREPGYVSVKKPIFPFLKLTGVDPILSPEMKSTGEVMGIDVDFPRAFYKAESSIYNDLPLKGNVLIAVSKRKNKEDFVQLSKELSEAGFRIFATEGTQKFFQEKGITATAVPKVREDPKIIDMIRNKELNLIINVPGSPTPGADGFSIRRAAVENNVPYIVTLEAAIASVKAINALKTGEIMTKSLQEYYADDKK
ncbi:MAG: carbamoyl-phosphate synthase large subunit [Nanoarchaeota archaeon]|nr:carbamoyl-phosphate synthase large subunit [Nanoarchaeota archaeon]